MDEITKNEIKDWIKSFIIALATVLIIKYFIFDIMPIDNISMQPTLYAKNRVFVNIIEYKIIKPRHFDVIIFTPPTEKRVFYVKRIIAIAGDTLKIQNGKVFVNDEQLNENYLDLGVITDGSINIKIPDGMVFVMGDNREHSIDSRSFGPISINAIHGHASTKLYPFNEIGKL